MEPSATGKAPPGKASPRGAGAPASEPPGRAGRGLLGPQAPVRSVLFLAGVFPRDVVQAEALFEEQVLERAAGGGEEGGPLPRDDPAHPFDRIPEVFRSLEAWPARTNLSCWQCDHTFDGPPVFVPADVREGDGAARGGLAFGVRGNFCSFGCAEAWAVENLREPHLWAAREGLRLVFLMFTGRHVANLRPAPPKTLMAKYGGGLSADAYWQAHRKNELSFSGPAPGGFRPETAPPPLAPEIRPDVVRQLLRRAEGGGAPVAVVQGRGAFGFQPPGSEVFHAAANSCWGVCGVPEAPAPAVPAPIAPAPAQAPAPAPAPALAVPCCEATPLLGKAPAALPPAAAAPPAALRLAAPGGAPPVAKPGAAPAQAPPPEPDSAELCEMLEALLGGPAVAELAAEAAAEAEAAAARAAREAAALAEGEDLLASLLGLG